MNDALMQNAYSLHRAGNLAEAERLYGEVLRLNPKHVDALYLLGFTHFQRGQYDEALRRYDQALAISPRAETHAARGAALSCLTRHAEALAAYDHALQLNPDLSGAWSNRGNALLELGRAKDALASYDKAIALKPDYGDGWRNRATALTQLGRIGDALDSLDRALQLRPDFADALEDSGRLLMRLHRHADAVAIYDKALALRPHDTNLLYNRGNALAILKRYDEAIRDSEALLALASDYPYARGVLLHSKLQSCDWRDIAVHRAKTSEELARGQRMVSPFNHKALSDSPLEQLQCARIWTVAECPAAPAPLWRGERYAHDRIRLGYVSADFNNTAVASAMAGVFEHHDRSRFETIAVSFGPNHPSPMRTRLEDAFECFVDVRDKSDLDIAVLMRRMEIDIAIDLLGFTGECRTGILAHRSVPVQVNYLGFPGTMGAGYIDYIIADETVLPRDQRAFYAEKVAYLPHTYLPADGTRAIAGRTPSRTEAGLPETGFVFCSFNNSYKFAPEMFEIWMRLLRAVEGSVLWLPEGNAFARRNLLREAGARGVPETRLVFAPLVPSPAEHLARLRLADLFLDTLPYNAHSTAVDALWAGLPLLTCAGTAFAGRVGASLLSAAGVPELVVGSVGDYQATALKLARDPAALTSLREKLARTRASCALFDTARFTRHLEAVYAEMHDRQQRGLPPEHFAVQAAG